MLLFIEKYPQDAMCPDLAPALPSPGYLWSLAMAKLS